MSTSFMLAFFLPIICLVRQKKVMVKVQVKKRGTTFQYTFEIAPQDGKRKWATKSGFKTKAEAQRAGIKALNEYLETGHNFTPSQMSYSDYLDYWMEEYCLINLKHRTIETYKNIIKNHIKPRIGMYRLSQLTTATIQETITDIYVERGFAKSYMKSILKVIKSSFAYATEIVQFVKYDPSIKVKVPKYDEPEKDPAHIFTKEEIDLIFDSVKKNHCVYYAFLTAYHTGLRISEVFGLTWEDIDLDAKKIYVRRNIVKKNQAGGTHKRLVEKSTTVWYFGTCKTKKSYRTVDIGDTLVEALREYKKEQEIFKEMYGDMYMKHYKKVVENPYNKKPETKIVNAYAEIEVALPEVHLVFLKDNGVFEGTDSCKHPFKVIHYQLGIPCRFHDFRDTHATRLIEAGADIKAVSKRLGHSTVEFTYNIYVRVTTKMEEEVVSKFEEYAAA